MKNAETILELKGITVSYDNRPVISNFSMQLKRGELVAIVGASGSGKSSLIRAILGFVPIASGEMFVNGVSMRTSEIRKHTAYLPQDLSFPCEWVSEVLDMPFSFKNNREKKVTVESWRDSFGKLGLDNDIMDKRLNEISGGQRQRMMVALCSLLDKELVILDEPTSALDAASVDLVIRYIKDMALRGKTVISVTHDKNFASACDRVIDINL